MNMKKIKELIDLLDSASLSAIEVKEGENMVRLEKNSGIAMASIGAITTDAPVIPQSAVPSETVPAAAAVTSSADDFKAPIIGIYYGRPSPDAKPFVEVGTKVKKGMTLCIIEAMKVMNEVSCDRDGFIAEICVNNADVVEYGQVLFKIK